MSRHFVRISEVDLAKKIIEAWEKHDDNQYDKDEGEAMGPIERVHNLGTYCFRTLTPKIDKDLDKVSFDFENCDSGRDGFGYTGITGINTLANGLTYLGVTAGGDWECPVFFIIYWNGISLRAYIPKKGNCWNYKLNEAIGNHDEADQKFLAEYLKGDYVTDKYGGDVATNAELLRNTTFIVEDMMTRIKEQE